MSESASPPNFWSRSSEFFLKGCPEEEPCLWFFFGAVYALLAVATLVQLVRILSNFSGYGWTMQKTFHVLNLVVCTCRAVGLCVWNLLDTAKGGKALEVVLFNAPNLLFFSTYTLLVLFWSEIVHAATPNTRIQPRTVYTVVNVMAYLLSVGFWIMCALGNTQRVGRIVDTSLHVLLNLLAAVGFAVYGYKLLTMLKRSPVVSPMRQRKIVEIAVVTVLSILCFCGKGVLEILALVGEKGLDFDNGMLLDSLFYGVTEILVIVASLGVLSGMPNRKESDQQQQQQQSLLGGSA